MDTTEILAIIVGIVLIALTLWCFFAELERVAAQIDESDVQEINATVKGGYSPDVIVVRENQPVRLNFYRDETASSGKAGEFNFVCGMNMLRGKLIVEPN